ncbi:hypothetical protein OC25_03235 [Pedobacter kyungheensis]|uniref:Uncharacterized protein n=1 Tax=Pedobacter kyungheensis TaxID=1069985 RepID=A0A0C1DQ00_9SPHI|nr:YDG domain-containing protein [Pedobacter kyungheensis]KIA96125.1 hypothetical protein OC25_03235 [Pedobacter kyungheensis]
MKALLRKQLLRYLVPFCLALCFGFSASAQCTLGPGDLVFTGYNQLDDGVNGATVDDSFSFMILKDIPAGQVIYFTDLGWTSANAFQPADKGRSDAILKWTADVAYTAGTEVIVTCKYILTAKSRAGTPRGTIAIQQDSYNTTVLNVTPAEHMSLAEISGDQLFAFVNTVASPTFLAGISINRDPLAATYWDATLSNTTTAAERSMLPAALASGAQNLGIRLGDPGDPSFPAAQIARYNKTANLKTGTASALLNAINTPGNWEIEGTGNPWNPSVTAEVYTVIGVSITTHPADRNNICPGTSPTFTVVASNVCAYQWQESTDGTTFNNLTEGGLYTGTKTATLTITNATTLGGRQYRVVLSGANGLTSNAANLTLLNPTLTFNATLAGGTYNTAYSQTANVTSGGSGTFTYTVNSGALPNGLTLASATGVISGTPTLAGTYNFDIKATDNCATANTGTKSYSIVIAKANQTITLADQTKTYGDASFTLTANTDGNLPITYSSGTTTVATISGNTVTIVGAGTSVITATQAGNSNYNAATTVTKTLTVNKKDLTLTLNAAPVITKTYDNSTTAFLAASNYNLVGKVGGDIVSASGIASYDTPAVGSGKTVTVNTFALAGSAKNNYNLTTTTASTTGSITKADISGTFTASDKTYDGNTTTSILTKTLTGVLPADASDVNLTGGTAAFGTADVANGKTVTATGMTLGGTKAANYNLTGVATTTANITKLDISGTFTASDKAYDGNANATISGRSLVGVLPADAATVSLTGGTATFSDEIVGVGKTVTSTGMALAGTKAGNYNLTGVATTTASISKLNITGSFTADNKAYDGNTTASILTRSLTGVLAGDLADVTLTGGTATFNTADVANGKTVTATGMTLTGTKAGNYNLNSVTTTTANITGLTLTGNFTADNKVYDGNNTATILTRTLTGVLPADAANVSLTGGSATFNNENVANGKTVTASGMTLGGTKAANYTLSTINTTIANITAKDVTGNFTAGNKAYDGNNTATILTRTLTGVLPADAANVSATGGTATFNNESVGTGKTVTATGITLTGTRASNYNLTGVATATANITGLTLTGAFTADNKVYDGNTTASVLTRTLTGVLPADVADVNLTGGTAAFGTADVANGKTVTATGMTLGGTKAANYTLSSVTTTTADITKKDITGTITAGNKRYDGNNTATLSGRGLVGVVAGDLANVTAAGGTATFNNENAATGKTVTATGITLTGTKAGNYNLTSIATTTADITAKDISGTFTADNKAYDGNTTASILTRTLTGVLAGDVADVTLTGGTATFATATAGTGKTVTATGMTLGGAKAANYNLTSVATTTANITGLSLTGNFTADNKVYDGNNAANVLTRTLTGVLPADVADVTLTGGSATFADADKGTGKTVTSTGMILGGTKAANYTLASVNTTTADITAKDITANFTAGNKAYDGTNAATILTRTLTGVLPADASNVSATGGTATFNNEIAGTGKTVTATGLTLTGTKAANYNLTGVATTTANITGLALTGAFTADNKVYDGNTTASVLTRTLTGVLPADAADVSLTGGTATFGTADVGTGKTVTAAGMTLGGTKAANYTLSSVATTTANITGLALTGSFTADNKVYDGTNAATILTRTLAGVLPADIADVTLTGGTATFGGINTGNGKNVTSTGMVLTGAKAGNYTLFAVNTTTANITPKDITGTFTAANKAYDGNTTASILTRSLTGVVPADVADVSLIGGTATFATATAGTGKTVTSTGMTLDGTKAENYNLTGVATTTANITGLALTGNFTVSNKVYDGTTNAVILTRTLTGILAADAADVTLTGGSATFADADKGTGKTVTATGMTLGGTKAANYTLGSVNTAIADITAKDLTASFTADNKVYDGNATANILTRTLTGVLAADVADVTVSGGTATFNNESVGTGKSVNASGLVLAGAKGGNYNITTVNATTANITAKNISGNFTADNKVYDGNTTATVLTRTLTGVLAGDVADVTLTGGTASFATASVGTGKTVTSTGMAITGAKAANYSLTGVATTTANITGLTITGNITAANKVYDGSANATILTRTLTGVLAADAADVTLSGGTATFADANKGTGKTVTATGLALTGAKAANYTLASVGTTTADITAKDIAGNFTADNKVYDGNTTASILTRTLTGVLAGDVADVTLTGGTASFATASIGTGKTVTSTGMSLSGSKAANYNLTGVGTATANITGLTITGNFTADNKVYDGNATATVLTRTLTGVLPADAADVTLTGGTASFADANKGAGKTVTAAGMTITGTKAANYTLSSVATTTADITAKDIAGNFTADSKVYDGATTANILTRTLTGVLAADVADVTLTGGTANFANANVGTAKTVSATGLTLTGAKAANYNLTGVANTTANITAKNIAGAFTADNKAYDGNTTATILTRTLTGVITADIADVTLSGGTASFADANIGTGKTVTSTGMVLAGSKAANYNLTGVATTTANIGVKTITGSFTADNKVYDGNTTATVLTRSLAGVLTADAADVTLTGGTASFADANVATGKTVTSTGMALTGAKAANYSLTSVATTTAAITAKTVNGSITASNKVYDGTTTAAITGRTLTGVLTADVADVSLTGGTATFADKNVGTAKVVTGAGLLLSGAKAANYTLASVATTTANISVKPITVTADAKTKVYGAADPALTYTLSAGALATGDNTTGALSRAAGEVVGTYAIAQNTLSAGSNYTITYVPANLEITRKALVITADNKNKNFGAANPALTASYSGFVGTETAAVLTSPVVLSTTATTTSSAGNYPITASGAAAANYSITYVAGTLTINPTAQTITFAALPNKLDTDGTFTLTATASSGLPVTYTSSNPTVARIINGNQVEILKAGVINITASQAGNADYQAATNVVQSFTVIENPPPVITITSNKGNSISKGEVAVLTASGALTYQWSNANGILSGQNNALLTVRPSQTTTYTVTGFNQYGRSSTKTFTLEVRADYQVLNIMNVITPNGDGKNDTWKVENIDMYPNNTVKVFDRSGKLVFEMKGYDNSWGGTFRGSVLPEGAYYYIIDFGPGVGVRKGYITIVGQQ